MENSNENKKLCFDLNSNDCISRLPDSLIFVIFSFLPIKTIVATTRLSKRWRSLWNSVPYIDLDENEVAPEESKFHFKDIVSEVFFTRKGKCSMEKFRFKCTKALWDPNYNDAWIGKAIQLEVQELDLHLNIGDLGAYEIPEMLYSYNNLVVLKLSGSDFMMNVPSRVDLPNLKVLHLLCVKYKGHHSISNLLAGCPVLEELFVERDGYDNILDYEIAAPSVRRLIVILWCYEVEDLDRRSRINTVHLRNMRSLVEAKLDVYPSGELVEKDYKNSLGVLQAVSKVRLLELSQSTMRALGFVSQNFPVFQNLVRLKLDGVFYYWGVLLNLLLNSPFLEHLTLTKPSPHCCAKEVPKCWSIPPIVPTCLSSHLTTVCLEYGFTGSDDEMKCVKFILEKSFVLETMTIKCCPKLDLTDKFAFQQKIAMFERRSKKCLLKFD